MNEGTIPKVKSITLLLLCFFLLAPPTCQSLGLLIGLLELKHNPSFLEKLCTKTLEGAESLTMLRASLRAYKADLTVCKMSGWYYCDGLTWRHIIVLCQIGLQLIIIWIIVYVKCEKCSLQLPRAQRDVLSVIAGLGEYLCICGKKN